MRPTASAVSTAILISAMSMGCKSAPKMTWWKNSDSTKIAAAESSVAPQLPSEVALQAGDLQSVDSVQISTAPSGSSAREMAPAFTPTAGAYPNTGARSYVPSMSQENAASSPVANSSMAMPYNPSAVPAPKQDTSSLISETQTGTTGSQADRYGANAPGVAGSDGSAYSSKVPSTGNYAVSTTIASTAGDSGNQADFNGPLGSRYSESPSSQSVMPNFMSSDAGVQTASAVSGTQPYRPGGTSSYPATGTGSATYEVATRTDDTVKSDSPESSTTYPGLGTQYR